MYTPELDPKEVARDLVDITREGTDASVKACASTVKAILLRLMKSITEVKDLEDIRKAFQNGSLLDWEDSYDARRLDALIIRLSENIDDKAQQSWTFQDDEEELIEMLAKFTSLLVKADSRVLLRKLGDCKFLQKLVVLYEVEQRSSVQNAVAKTLSAACKLSRKFTTYLLHGNLPVVIATLNAFKLPLSKLENSSLRLLQILYSTDEKPPETHNDAFTSDFLVKMLALVGIEDMNALQFLIYFNYQFDEEINPVLEVLSDHESVTFGHMLIKFFNKNRDDNELASLKMVYDIYAWLKVDLITKTFYINDLKVLTEILSEVILETNVPSRITMILKIFEKMLKMENVPQETIFSALRVFIKSDSLEDAVVLKAQALVPPELLLTDEPFYDVIHPS